MKKILVVVSFILAAFSFQANAATYNIGTVADFETIGGYLTEDNGYTDTWNFNVLFQSVISASATNTFAKFKANIVGKINGFSATLDGVNLGGATFGNAQLLSIDNLLASAGEHSLVISGASEGSYGGSIAVAQTPIPAAVWLFGSALMGMMGVSRRKKA
jgi:hypothetical protein